MDEDLAYYALIAVVLGGLRWFGLARDWRTGEAIRRFAERHGLQYDKAALWKGVRPSASGRYLSWKLSIGPVVIGTCTKGIGPSNRDVAAGGNPGGPGAAAWLQAAKKTA